MENNNNTKQTQVLVLGTYHFGKGGKHAVNMKIADVMTDKKQQEIKEVVDKLAAFNPNKIAVEQHAASFEELNSLYSDHCLKKNNINSDIIAHRHEIIQLGFRLAAQLNHSKIYPIDFPVSLPFELAMEYAEKNLPELYQKFNQEIMDITKEADELQKNETVGDILKYYNNPERISNEHSNLYLYPTQIGAGENYYGADILTEWYKRNTRIFANLQSISEPGDRILVIYGAGHCKILRDFISSYNHMELIEAMDYL